MQRRPSGIVIRHIERQLNMTNDQRRQIEVILEREEPTIESLATRAQEQNMEPAHRPDFNEADVRNRTTTVTGGVTGPRGKSKSGSATVPK